MSTYLVPEKYLLAYLALDGCKCLCSRSNGSKAIDSVRPIELDIKDTANNYFRSRDDRNGSIQ